MKTVKSIIKATGKYIPITLTLIMLFIAFILLIIIESAWSGSISRYIGFSTLEIGAGICGSLIVCAVLVKYVRRHRYVPENELAPEIEPVNQRKTDESRFQLKQKLPALIFIMIMALLVIGSIWEVAFSPVVRNNYFLIGIFLSGAAVFWIYRHKLDFKSEAAEEAERTGFSGRFPRINRLPVVRWFIRWMYKEGWWYSGGLLLILAAAFILRIWNLTILDPYTDEYNHLLSAKQYLETGSFEYTRANLVTYLTIFSCWIGDASSFSEYVFWGRVPGVIFGTLTIIPLYLLSKKISKPVGIITAILWATSPWAIGVAKTVREYAFYPLIIMIALLLAIRLMRYILDYTRSNNWKIIALLVTITGFLSYALFVDTLSTLKVGALVIFSAVIYTLMINIKRLWALFLRHKFISVSAIVILLSAGGFLVYYAGQSGQMTLTSLEPDTQWLGVFFNTFGTPMHWWDESVNPLLFYSLLPLGLIYALGTRNKNYFLHVFIFCVLLVFYIFFFDRYFRERYIFYALPFFCALLASSIYAVIFCFRRLLYQRNRLFKSSAIAIVTVIVIFTQLFSYHNVTYPATSSEHGYVKTTNEYHDRIQNIIGFLDNVMEEDDILITSLSAAFKLVFDETEMYYYDYSDEERFENIEAIIDEHPQGLMVLDWRRNGRWTPGYQRYGSFFIGEQKVEVIMNTGYWQIYRWKR